MELKRNPPTLRTNGFRQKFRAKVLSRHLRVFKDSDRTLDLGCGWGGSLLINPKFWLVDADSECISTLKKSTDRAFLCDLAQPLPFEKGFFENAFTHDVLEHLEAEEMQHLFHEVRRVVRPGGLFMNVVPNRKGFVAGLNPQVGHKRFVTRNEVEKSAEIAGFKLVRCYRAPLGTRASELFVHNKLVTLCRAI